MKQHGILIWYKVTGILHQDVTTTFFSTYFCVLGIELKKLFVTNNLFDEVSVFFLFVLNGHKKVY